MVFDFRFPLLPRKNSITTQYILVHGRMATSVTTADTSSGGVIS